MDRTRRRLSRTFIALLLITLAVGAIYYIRRVGKEPTVVTPQSIPVIRIESAAVPAAAPITPPPASVTPPPPPQQVVAAPASPTPAAPANVQISGPDVLADGRGKIEAGQLIEARRTLNDALLSGQLSAADGATVRQLLSTINQAVVFSPQRFSNDPFGGTYVVKPGEVLARIASNYGIPWELLARMNKLSDPRKLRAGATIKVIRGPFHAVVDKSRFTLDVYLGSPGGQDSVYITTYPVGLGKDDSTPMGTWQVTLHNKLRNPPYYSPRGEGVIAAGDPRNPLGGYWIGLTGSAGEAVGKTSYGIHGTIEPDSIGKQESLGCIRLRNEDVSVLFDLLMDGKSTVVVK